MTCREEVISNLETVYQWVTVDIKFAGGFPERDYETMAGWISNAIALLKEQEAEWIEYPECLVYDGAYSDSHIVCSACKHVFSIMDNCTEEFDYCPHCGAKMEGR